ncbi:MAG: methionine--tRNA ligase, partial [Hyphomicrobiales bacterium]
MQPTPNGRLHIGHGSGPYLRADTLARAYRRDGHRVDIITGSDAYENWVELAAAMQGEPVEQLCRIYHKSIGDDLKNIGVEVDVWIDPTSDEHRRSYFALHDAIVADVRQSGHVALEQERILISRTGRPIIGPWLVGLCPHCGESCGGNTCVACGLHFQPGGHLEKY